MKDPSTRVAYARYTSRVMKQMMSTSKLNDQSARLTVKLNNISNTSHIRKEYIIKKLQRRISTLILNLA